MNNVVGTWRLHHVVCRDAQGRDTMPSYGPDPMGLIMFKDNGRMMYVLIDGRAEMPAGEKREYGSYCGSYTIEGSTLTTRVDAANDPARMADQVRPFRFEGKYLVLTPPPRQFKGETQYRELYWEKLA